MNKLCFDEYRNVIRVMLWYSRLTSIRQHKEINQASDLADFAYYC